MIVLYASVFTVLIAVIVIVRIKAGPAREKRRVLRNNVYLYTAKPLPMTKTEAEFFARLNRVVQDRYYVFPQVHLSALFDHRVQGQDWHFAFRHINGKSVDYVLCDKSSLRPTYAIELDDYSHAQKIRYERDKEVERIFLEANLPLVRFNNKDIPDESIIQSLTEARTGANIRDFS